MRNSSRNESETSLIEYAEQAGISIYYGEIPLCESMSLYSGGKCYIAIDPFSIKSMADGTVKIGHETGHCITGSFYNRWAACDVREKHEYRADKWAAHYLLPPDKLRQAMEEGHTEPWELAEQLNVTEDFLRRAVYIYRCEGMLPE